METKFRQCTEGDSDFFVSKKIFIRNKRSPIYMLNATDTCIMHVSSGTIQPYIHILHILV